VKKKSKALRQAKAERLQHHQTRSSTNAKGSLVDNIYRGLVLYPFGQSLSFVEAFNPFIFKVIIDKYDPVTIYSVALGSFLQTFSVFLV